LKVALPIILSWVCPKLNNDSEIGPTLAVLTLISTFKSTAWIAIDNKTNIIINILKKPAKLDNYIVAHLKDHPNEYVQVSFPKCFTNDIILSMSKTK
jgi:hypothetical protein